MGRKRKGLTTAKSTARYFSGRQPNYDPWKGDARRETVLDRADRVRAKLLAEAKLLEKMGDERHILLREAVLSLPITSLERLA